MMKLGNLDLRYGLFLAPMAGNTDRAMREVCREHGAEAVVSEMISAKAVTFGDKNTFALAEINENELPASIQIFGSEPEVMAKGAAILVEKSSEHGVIPSAIDINMGCPMKKIVNNGEGAALMKTPVLAGKIVEAVKKSVSVPVTVKIRTGWDREHKNAVEVAHILEESGADMITVHGRTREDMYSPGVDMDVIAEVKKAVSVPVVGNGDIYNAGNAADMLKYTACDGLMIGRGALGNPWIFDEIKAYFDGKTFCAPTLAETVGVALHQLYLAAEYKSERIAVLEGRRMTAYYIKGFQGAAELRAKINRCESVAGIEAELKNVL